MIIKSWRMPIGASVAVAVLLVYSVPVRALADAKYVSKRSASSVTPQTEDDDDDDLSGGALAVLLLAIGGAVAGVLYAPKPNSGQVTPYQTIAFNKAAGQTITVTLTGTDREGKPTNSRWIGQVDGRSRTMKVTMDGTDRRGKLMRANWTGQVDGTFYPVAGARTSEEWSYTKINARTLGFTARHAGRVKLTGRIVVSTDGRSFTIATNGINSKGRRVNRQVVYEMRQ